MSENIHWSEETRTENDPKVTVRCGIHGTLLGPYVLDATVNGGKHAAMLNEVMKSYRDDVTSDIMTFQQDGAHLYFALTSHQWLNAIPGNWIGC
jgi:hypothetical protein